METWDVDQTFKLAQTTLMQLMNKSHEGFVLSKCQEMIMISSS